MKNHWFSIENRENRKKSGQKSGRGSALSKSAPIGIKIGTLLLDIMPKNNLEADFLFLIPKKVIRPQFFFRASIFFVCGWLRLVVF